MHNNVYVYYIAVQIHHDRERLHWVTSSYSNGEVLLYDSSSTGTVSLSLQSQLTEIYKNVIKDNMLMVTIVPMQQQDGPFDCGLFSIAAAYYAALGRNIRTVSCDQSIMRSHLKQCFIDGKLSSFPASSEANVKRCQLKHIIIHVYCVCLKIESYDSNMIECDGCQKWFHFKCVQLKEEPSSKWFCFECNANKENHHPSTPPQSSTEDAARVQLLREMSTEDLITKFADIIPFLKDSNVSNNTFIAIA